MKISVNNQNPILALLMLMVIVATGYLRFGLAPYDNEYFGGRVVPVVAGYLSDIEAAWGAWSLVAAAAMCVAAGMVIGQMGGRFGIYPSKSFMSMPIFGILACGIFISADVLASSLSALLAAMSLRYMCRGYIRDGDLTSMLYAGLCTGSMLLVSTSGAVYVVAALAAVFILSFSSRELLVLFAAMVLPAALCGYVEWLSGREFLGPVAQFAEALCSDSLVMTFGNNAVGALALCGVAGLVFLCAVLRFFADRYVVPVKQRGVFIYNIVLVALSLLAMALPSSSVGDFAVAAVPMSMLMPLLFIRNGVRHSDELYLLMWALYVIHLFYY